MSEYFEEEDGEEGRYCRECDKGTRWDWDNCPYNCACTYSNAYRLKKCLKPRRPKEQSNA